MDTHASIGGTGGHLVECPMRSRDGMDRGTHSKGGHPMDCPTIPWDCGMGWTFYSISGPLCNNYKVNKYRLHHEVEVGMGFTQPRAEGPRIV